MGGHDPGTELGADALGQPGGTQTRDELPTVLLSPSLVKLLTAESRTLDVGRVKREREILGIIFVYRSRGSLVQYWRSNTVQHARLIQAVFLL